MNYMGTRRIKSIKSPLPYNWSYSRPSKITPK